VDDGPYELPMQKVFPIDAERADARRNRKRILCAAAALVESCGVDGVSMDDVAAKAGVGKGTLYRRFGDRASLLRALIEEPEREFQEALIRGAAPLGPGAPPLDRLHAFGAGLIQLLERTSRFIRPGEGEKTGRFNHPVYAAYRAHVALLLGELLGAGTRTDYLVDALLAPLGADAFLFQRDARRMSLEEITDGWCALADAIVATIAPASELPSGN
jgi:AcrR family transcriptional regulator